MIKTCSWERSGNDASHEQCSTDSFHRVNFTFRGQESGCAFCAAVCKLKEKKCYNFSLTSALKIKEAASFKVTGLLYNCLLIMNLPLIDCSDPVFSV